MYIFNEINICAKIQLIWIKYTNIRYQKYVIFAQIMHVLPAKKCCEARGCTNFQITGQLCNCKHIVCKILHIILLLDVSMTLINNLHLGTFIAKVKDHDFYR